MPQKIEFRNITPRMSDKDAEEEYKKILALDLDENGCYNEDSVDAVIVGDMLQGLKPPTKAQVKERWRQNALKHAGKADEEIGAAYAATLGPEPRAQYEINYAFKMLIKWCPEIWDIPPDKRGPQIGRLQAKLEQLGWRCVRWTINMVATRLIFKERPRSRRTLQ